MAGTEPDDPSAMMRAAAARLMGNSDVAPSQPPPAASKPRALSGEPSATSSAPAHVAAPATPAFVGFAPLTAEKTPTPAVKISEPAANPSPFTAEQLAEAQAFSAGATRGAVRKPRPSAITRLPKSGAGPPGLSSSPQASYTTAANRSPRPSVTAPPPRPSATAPLTAHRPPTLATSRDATNGFLVPTAKPNSKESVTFGKPSTIGNAMPPVFASTLGDSIVVSSQSSQKAAEPLSPAPSFVKPALTASRADATPPHLRWNALANSGTTATTAKSAVAQQEEVKKEIKKDSPTDNDSEVKQPVPSKPVVPSVRVKEESSDSEYVVITSKPDKAESFSSITAESTTASSASNKGPALADIDIEKLLANLTSAVNRIADLEQENFTIQRKVEELVQMEERRRYLGTTDAKAPFELSVKCRNAYYKVQANAALKVADLIRRVRVASNTLPGDSPEPRLVVEGQQVGHVLTLHEAGVTPVSSLEFVHAGAEEDEEF